MLYVECISLAQRQNCSLMHFALKAQVYSEEHSRYQNQKKIGFMVQFKGSKDTAPNKVDKEIGKIELLVTGHVRLMIECGGLYTLRQLRV